MIPGTLLKKSNNIIPPVYSATFFFLSIKLCSSLCLVYNLVFFFFDSRTSAIRDGVCWKVPKSEVTAKHLKHATTLCKSLLEFKCLFPPRTGLSVCLPASRPAGVCLYFHLNLRYLPCLPEAPAADKGRRLSGRQLATREWQ